MEIEFVVALMTANTYRATGRLSLWPKGLDHAPLTDFSCFLLLAPAVRRCCSRAQHHHKMQTLFILLVVTSLKIIFVSFNVRMFFGRTLRVSEQLYSGSIVVS